jgi:atypical dual specificity phosphatase
MSMRMMQFGWIEEGKLAASDFPRGVSDLYLLHEQGVRAIVTLTEYPLGSQRDMNDAIIAEIGFSFAHFPIDDMRAPHDPFFTYPVMEFIDAMQAEDKPVMVHCLAGMGRTGTMLHAYYLHRGLTLEQARARIDSVRPHSAWNNLSEVQQNFLVRLAAAFQKGWQV